MTVQISKFASRVAAGLVAGVVLVCGLQAQAANLTLQFQIDPTQVDGATFVDSTHATVSAVGQKVDLLVFAVIASANSTQTDDGLLQAYASFVSIPNGANPVLHGDMRGGSSLTVVDKTNNVFPFDQGTIATSGFARNLISAGSVNSENVVVPDDGDIDVGDITTTSTASANSWFIASSTDGASVPTAAKGTLAIPGALSQLIGKTTFTVTTNNGSPANGQSTLIDVIPRNKSAGGTQTIQQYSLDGNLVTDLGPAVAHSGAIVTFFAPSPEPSTLVLMGLGGLGMLVFRRRRSA